MQPITDPKLPRRDFIKGVWLLATGFSLKCTSSNLIRTDIEQPDPLITPEQKAIEVFEDFAYIHQDLFVYVMGAFQNYFVLLPDGIREEQATKFLEIRKQEGYSVEHSEFYVKLGETSYRILQDNMEKAVDDVYIRHTLLDKRFVEGVLYAHLYELMSGVFHNCLGTEQSDIHWGAEYLSDKMLGRSFFIKRIEEGHFLNNLEYNLSELDATTEDIEKIRCILTKENKTKAGLEMLTYHLDRLNENGVPSISAGRNLQDCVNHYIFIGRN